MRYVRKMWVHFLSGMLLVSSVCVQIAEGQASKVELSGTVVQKTVKAGVGFRQGVWYSLSTTDGLSGEIVRSIAQDREGRLWFCTNNGLSHFDGEYITNYTFEPICCT